MLQMGERARETAMPRLYGLVLFLVMPGLFTTAQTAFELTAIDRLAIGYATFQSHNQKVVANQHGYFMTYILSRDEAYLAQTWRLMRSEDQGKTFRVVHEATHATNPPPIETDKAGNIYLARPDYKDGNAYLSFFAAKKDFQDPRTTLIPGGAAGKVTLLLDENDGCLYYASHNNRFYKLALDGTVLENVQIVRQGPHAGLQYPLLRQDPAGALHYAWTSQQNGVYMYWDIHHMLRPRGATQWQNLDGTPVMLPAVADDTSAAAQISLADEYESFTWLSSFTLKGGKAHFLYLTQSTPHRQNYVRLDAKTGEEELRLRLDDLYLLSGLLVAPDASVEAPLFIISAFQGQLKALVSQDNGETWKPYAKHEEIFNVYSLGGCNTVTDDGYIIGSFTDQKAGDGPTAQESTVYFYRLGPLNS
jgi:hypothetical protein